MLCSSREAGKGGVLACVREAPEGSREGWGPSNQCHWCNLRVECGQQTGSEGDSWEWGGRVLGALALEAVSSGQKGAMQSGQEREEGLGMCRGVCEGSVPKREGGQREDLDSVSGVARVTVMGTSRGLMEERWKQWRQGKKDGKEVMGLGAFCGKFLD